MSNSKNYTINEDGTIILNYYHSDKAVEVRLNKEERRLQSIKNDEVLTVNYSEDRNEFVRSLALYDIHYYDETDTWTVEYKLKGKTGTQWKDGFKTARQAWLYREGLIAGDIAER